MGNFEFDYYIKEEKNEYESNNKQLCNVINGIIKIKDNNFKQRIINSYENWKIENPDEYEWNKDSINATPNEEKIKQSDIYINNKKIDFNYYYTFTKNGIYKIKYVFKDILTSINFLFYRCGSITSLDFSEFNGEYLTDMECAFTFCSSLTSLNLSKFNTSKVKNMRFLFHSCRSLKHLDISNFNTGNVINMEYMFFKCSSLISLDLKGFDTKNVENMECMFYKCCSLITLDLSNFDFSKVTNNKYMFENCHSLNIPKFNMKPDESTDLIFHGCNSLINDFIVKI